MNFNMKSPVILLVGLLVIFLSLAGGAFFFYQQEHAKNVALQAQLEDVKTKQKITEAKLQESQRAVSSLEMKVREAELQVGSLSGQITEEKAAKEAALEEAKQAKAELDRQKSLKTELENKFNQSQKNLERLQAQVVELENKRKELESKIKDVEVQQPVAKQAQKTSNEGVELGKIVVNPEASAAKQQEGEEGAGEGTVLVVNKDYSFVVISLGLREGVAVGDLYSVYHEDKYLGDVKVEKVHDSMSAAGFTATAVKEKIVEGDKVVRKGK